MRFIFPAIALLFLGFLCFCAADLRYASTPKNNFAVRNREGSIAFKAKTALYLEPSTFGYEGLLNEKENNYDNFLRSNIDNEQDFRNFNTEIGKDHLPFRTLEGRSTDASNQLSSALIVDPGQEYVLPLRMNHPHAYEIELNIWINQNTIVVPIKKPVCVGEGYRDAVLPFRIPNDFNDLGAKVQGFNGCQKIGDCVLQMYAHSVEPRAYAAGTPIIVRGWDSSKATANDNSQVQPRTLDPGTDLSKLSNDVCAVARLTFTWSAVPRWARHVSDVYNHAYQNSDYSPYSGQQHEAISKNLQAACILRMVNANRGELGQSILTQQQKNVLSALRNTADTIVKNYETITNRILTQVFWGDKTYDEVGRSMPDGPQPLNSCYRCAESSSVSANRIQMNTAIPSFDMQYPGRISEAQQLIQQINPKYSNLISDKGIIQIYVQALSDMAPLYSQLQSKYGLSYQGPMTKPSIATMADATGFRKMNANGFADGGKYAATQAKAAREARNGFGNNIIYNFDTSGSSLLNGINIDNLSGNEIELLTIPNSTPLSPNDDDNPSKQSGYSDSEDVIEASPINNDASLPYPTSDTSGTTYTSSTTPSTTPIYTSYRNTLPISSTGFFPGCLSASLSSNNNNNNYFYGSGGIMIPIIIGVGSVVIGIIIGFILSVVYHRRKIESRQEVINNIHTAV